MKFDKNDYISAIILICVFSLIISMSYVQGKYAGLKIFCEEPKHLLKDNKNGGFLCVNETEYKILTHIPIYKGYEGDLMQND